MINQKIADLRQDYRLATLNEKGKWRLTLCSSSATGGRK